MPEPQHTQRTDTAAKPRDPEKGYTFRGEEYVLGCWVWGIGWGERLEGGEYTEEDHEAGEEDPFGCWLVFIYL